MIRKLAEKADLKTRAELERVGYSDITVYGGLLFRKECLMEKG